MSSRSLLLSNVITYNLKVWLAGLSALVFVPLSIITVVFDVILNLAPENSFSQHVLRTSAQVEATLDIHGPLTDVQIVQTEKAS